MNLEFTETAWRDVCFWIDTDLEKIEKIKELIRSIEQSSYRGIGKPEPLRHEFKGCWSRRINLEHRLVYRIEGKRGKDQKCIILQCRYHYDK